MYLSDTELKRRLKLASENEKKLVVKPKNKESISETQIGTCSIDLTLSSDIWFEKRRWFFKPKLIDLRESFLDKQIHSKFWRDKRIDAHKGIILKPGKCFLARTDECIHIPQDCIGKIEARSGMNRLLLNITLGDFLNPGYIGQYPLQIINMSKHSIKIYPGTAVCQLLLAELDSCANLKFSKEISTYQHDDGGPASWWEDRQKKLFMAHVAEDEKKDVATLSKICEKNNLKKYESSILSRYRKYRKKNDKNPDNAIHDFLRYETKSSSRNQLFLKNLGFGFIIPALAFFIGLYIFRDNKGNIIVTNPILIGVVSIIAFVIFVSINIIKHKLQEIRYLDIDMWDNEN